MSQDGRFKSSRNSGQSSNKFRQTPDKVGQNPNKVEQGFKDPKTSLLIATFKIRCHDDSSSRLHVDNNIVRMTIELS
jgi:hypothetical protein